MVPAVLGNTIIILGFTQFWVGLRRLRNMPGGQAQALTYTVIAAGFMIALHDSERGRAVVYAAGQAIVMLVCLIHLLRNRLPGIGTVIAAIAFGVAMAGQIMVVTSNAAVLVGALDYEIYYALASYALLCTVFAAAVWNLGFAMLAIDGLHQTLTLLSQTDELTGLANRRAFRARLEDLQRKSIAGLSAYSVVLIDLDDFKPLNDRFGHAAGDAALQHFASLLLAATRSGDLVARLGGDEFSVLLPDGGPVDAQTVSDAIKQKIANTPLALPGVAVMLSASIGTASTAEDGAVDLVSLADTRLYEDKKQRKTRSKREPSRLQLVTRN